MTKRPAPLFLARQTYRRRRMMDAARLLPLAGIFLFLLPILWRPQSTPEPDTVQGVIYIFGVWMVLILAARLLAHLITRAPARETDEDQGEER